MNQGRHTTGTRHTTTCDPIDATGDRFPARLRIRRHDEFRRVLRRGRRIGDQRVQIWGLPNDRPYPRFGVIVGKKHGNAVARNRLKRVLREAFRLSRCRLPAGLDLACAPRVGAGIELSSVINSLTQIARRLARGYGISQPERCDPPSSSH